MKQSDIIRPFVKPLKLLQNLIEEYQCTGIIIGGLAVSLISRPRFTADIDAMVLMPIEQIHNLINSAINYGFITRIPDAENFACKNRVLLLQHQESGINIDISFGLLPFEIEAVKHSKEFKIEDFSIHLPSPEDLIIFKAIAHRPKDLLDIQAIIEFNPELHKKRIKKNVQEFAKLLDMPELWTDIKTYIEQIRVTCNKAEKGLKYEHRREKQSGKDR